MLQPATLPKIVLRKVEVVAARALTVARKATALETVRTPRKSSAATVMSSDTCPRNAPSPAIVSEVGYSAY